MTKRPGLMGSGSEEGVGIINIGMFTLVGQPSTGVFDVLQTYNTLYRLGRPQSNISRLTAHSEPSMGTPLNFFLIFIYSLKHTHLQKNDLPYK